MSFIPSLRQALAAAALVATTGAHAAAYTVDARDNSSSGGVGLDTISLLIGQSFSVQASPLDLWSAGTPLRLSNANGLNQDIAALVGDDSGAVPGTQIGINYGPWTQFGLAAPYGALVGQIGSGSYFLVGSSFNGIASTAGILKLYYWDENSGDNTGSIVANVSAVPEPQTYAMMLAGLLAVGFMGRRRRAD